MPKPVARARPRRTEPQSRSVLLICILLTLATIAVYAQAVRFEFVSYDDPPYVTENSFIREGLTRRGVAWTFTSEHWGNWHPVTGLSHMLDCEIYGLDPAGHHLTSVILHTLNTLLLFGALRSMTSSPWRSGLAAALFALHPLHVESVAWISERKDVLSTFFGLISIWAYGAYARRGHRPPYLVCVMALTLGLMSKPMLVTLPFVFLLLDYWPLDRVSWGGKAIGRLLLEKIPFFLLSAVMSVVTFFVQREAGAVTPSQIVPLGSRLANAAVSYVRYLTSTVWPTKLSVFYPHPDLGAGQPLSLGRIAASVLVLVVVSLAVTRARRHRYLPVGWLWYLGTLVPVIGLVQVGVQAMADRYTYVPLIGPFIAVAWLAGDLAERWRTRRPAAGKAIVVASVTIVAALGFAAHEQAARWRSSLTLFEASLRAVPYSPTLHYNYAGALQSAGRVSEAVEHYREAIRLNPSYAEAHNNLGLALASRGERAAAVAHYRTALRLRPDYPEAQVNLGAALRAGGDSEGAMEAYRAVLERRPEHAEARYNLGVALQVSGRLNEAIEQYRLALQAREEYGDAHHNLGVALQALGDIDGAVHHFRRAVQLQPNVPESHEGLGRALQAKGDPEAARHLERARQLRANAP